MMGSLLEKFEASAAERLAGHSPKEELARYTTFLKVESHRLRLRHRSGVDARQVCQDRALLVDVLIRQLWAAAKSSLSDQAQREFPPLALVAPVTLLLPPIRAVHLKRTLRTRSA